MAYFVTGATGFIGRHLVERLLARSGTIYVLVRKGSEAKLEELRRRTGGGADRIVAVAGDLAAPKLGVDEKTIADLRGKIDHFFHLAALYDMAADADSLAKANISGTKHAVEFAHAVEAGHLHHVSSIAAAGRYPGIFREDMFDEAEGLDDPYFRTKHDSEGIVRHECRRPWRVYRPGIVVGHSQTGEMDKIDGPYYFFRLLQRLRDMMPPWVPLLGIEGSRLNVVPVDFVAGAIDAIAHKPGLDKRAFHLVDPSPRRVGDVLNVFARAAGAPEFVARIDARMFAFIPGPLRSALASLPPVKRIIDQVLDDLGIPHRVLSYVDQPTKFDCRDTTAALEGTGVAVPDLESYAWRLWDYWERHLDPELFKDRSLAGAVRGKRILITGASGGIGRETALRIGAAGGTVLLVARSADKLQDVKRQIEEAGGKAHIHCADLSDLASCDALVAEVNREHDGIDVLVNNAGRSIRRSLALSHDRFHDFQRTMQLNYFGSLKLILGFLPGMRGRKRGHIVNVSSVGVQTSPPRFSAYIASKAALDAFSRCAASELVDDGVTITTVYMPLVRTEMIAPTKIYQAFPTISPEEAAHMICDAVRLKPKRIATRAGTFGEVAYAIAPKAVDVVLNTAYKLFPDSAAAKGGGPKEEVSGEAVAFAHLIPGVHW